jgi:ribosomal-protein-alanine N-acetyltransferase
MIAVAGPADARTLAAIEAEAAHDPWSEAALAATLATPACRAWVARDGERATGHLVTTLAGDVADVVTIAVRPTRRRQGIAAALLATAERSWRAAAVCEAFLEVRRSNTGARALYGGRGWVEVGARSGYYPDGEDAVVLRWTT